VTKIHFADVYDINKAIEEKDFKECPLQGIVPEQYHEFLPLFNKVLADRLPPHRAGIDHEVRLKDGEHRQKCKSTIDCSMCTRAAHSKLPMDPCTTRSLVSFIVDS
jgi:hypothetical protein